MTDAQAPGARLAETLELAAFLERQCVDGFKTEGRRQAATREVAAQAQCSGGADA